ncbi:hypothetical protein M0812_15314 [Anaeramoeba flamelloides]|uniref:PAS domain-containing protein n=1 Tax=Anaeramoeba flamelloides TaxID=1746091 RepID=A0AAV7ZFS8_9EUKA|nr:hypothetical protein M0812_15314 [Anaeramoeba flamelloides]
MGNQSTSKEIQIPKSRINEYFEIFHKVSSPLILIDKKKMSIVDLNNAFSMLLGYDRKELFVSSTTNKFWPEHQTIYQNKKSTLILKQKLKENLKLKTKTDFVFECLHSKGHPIFTQFTITKVSIWKNSIYQIVITERPSPFEQKTKSVKIPDLDFPNETYLTLSNQTHQKEKNNNSKSEFEKGNNKLELTQTDSQSDEILEEEQDNDFSKYFLDIENTQINENQK